ncbi:hypothetical protein [Paraburkholderia sp. BL6669N2]|uniref:hypothetical protein n=1 Tax=Paraburkholderia sp. BL6669N2 TaxID=1938807 RepID=UPI0011C01CC4|nr:hypothetical protein [Paraburkholderia sp. BL6669N2]
MSKDATKRCQFAPSRCQINRANLRHAVCDICYLVGHFARAPIALVELAHDLQLADDFHDGRCDSLVGARPIACLQNAGQRALSFSIHAVCHVSLVSLGIIQEAASGCLSCRPRARPHERSLNRDGLTCSHRAAPMKATWLAASCATRTHWAPAALDFGCESGRRLRHVQRNHDAEQLRRKSSRRLRSMAESTTS